MIKAIETAYKGYRFRSRLEARWAVFFDSLGIEWQYEPEGYELPGGERYLPDFYLPRFCGQGLWAEVKPEYDPATKARAFVRASGLRLMLLQGMPGARCVQVLERDDYPESILEIPCTFEAKYLPGGRNGDEYRLFWVPGFENEDGTFDESYLDASVFAAIRAARGARFEHGESGAAR